MTLSITSVGAFEINWRIEEDGKPVSQGKLPCPDLKPGTSEVIAIPYRLPQAQPGAEYFLIVGLTRPEAWTMINANHEYAAEQMKLPVARDRDFVPLKEMMDITLSESDGMVTVSGNDFTAVFHGNSSVGKFEQ